MSYSYSRQRKSRKRVFVSFDYDHDSELKKLLIGQSENENSPFEIEDWSIKEELTGDWKEKVRARIRKVEIVAVICGEHTDTANGVSTEVKISQEENKPYFLLAGKRNRTLKKPKYAKNSDKIYNWTWDNLKLLIEGKR